MRILVVEDNVTNCDVALAQIKKLGYEGSAASNGAEAIEAVQQCAPALVLMDCHMPVMDGFEAARRIRELAGNGIPIIAMTAGAMAADRERCLDAGMNDYLAKPVDLDRLAEVLVRWLPACGAAGAEETPGSGTHRRAQPAGPPAGGPDRGAFDEKALLWRLMGDRRLADIVLKGFLNDVPAQLDSLRRLLDEADAPAARTQAHALKGAAATVAAEDLHAIALALERAGADGQLGRCQDLLPRAKEEFERFKSALEAAGWA